MTTEQRKEISESRKPPETYISGFDEIDHRMRIPYCFTNKDLDKMIERLKESVE